MVSNNSCVRSSTWNTAARAIMDLPRKIERHVNADLNATGLIMLTCAKPSAQVTQVKQASQTLYTACAQRSITTHANYYAFITILFGKGKPKPSTAKARDSKTNPALTTHNAALPGKQVSSRRIRLHTLIQEFGERCLRNGHSALRAEFTPQRILLASMEFVENSTRAVDIPINPGRTCQLTTNPRCEHGQQSTVKPFLSSRVDGANQRSIALSIGRAH